RALCARQLAPERCPAASRLGYARLFSPLLDGPLEGPIYLREPNHPLPDLLADLRANGLHIVLYGHTTAPGGRLRIGFPRLPDFPLAKAQFTLVGGRRGVVANSESLCRTSRRAQASLSAHNGRQHRARPSLRLHGHC